MYLTNGDPAAVLALEKRFGSSIRIHQVQRSYAELAGLRDRIANDEKWFSSQGVHLTGVYPNVADNLVVGRVTSVTEALMRAARSRFGPAAKLVESPDMTSAAFGPWYDTQPWWAADSIVRSDGTQCTLGPTVRSPSSGNVYALVPWHCGGAGTNWFNGPPYTPDFSKFVGQVAYANGNSLSTDSGLIYSSASNRVWRNSNASIFQRSSAPSPQPTGAGGICVTGSLEGEICGTTVVWSDGCFPIDA